MIASDLMELNYRTMSLSTSCSCGFWAEYARRAQGHAQVGRAPVRAFRASLSLQIYSSHPSQQDAILF
eukprot:1769771-Pleurochrysis_carterae.AAC.3